MVGFANFAILAGLAGLAVPVLLHLMKRQQARNVVFPSVRFLRRSQLPQAGRRTLRDIPLLLLRMLLFALLVLVFSRPFWQLEPEEGGTGAKTQPNTHVILLDVSASMAADEQMERARKAALERLDDAGPADRIGVVLSANQVVRELSPSASRRDAENAIRKAEPTFFAGRHRSAVERAARMMPADGNGSLIIVSDFQRGDWSGLPGDLLPPGIQLELLPVEAPESANWAVLSARVQSAGEDRVVVRVKIRSFANVDKTVPVQLVVGERVLAETETEVPARGVAIVELAADHFSSPEARLRIGSDGYAADDEFHVWLGAQPPPKVLLAAPFADVPEVRTDVFFLRQALGIPRGTAQGRFEVEQVDTQFLFGLNPSGYSALLLVRPGEQLNKEGIEIVRKFVDNGGCAMVFPGARAAGTLRLLKEHGLLDASYRGLAQPDVSPALEEVHGHPLDEVFGGNEPSDLFLTRLHRYARLEVGDNADVLVTAEKDEPVVLRQTLGRGAVLTFAMPPNPQWTDLPLRLAFVPLVHELLADSLPDDRGVESIACGETPAAPPDLLGESDAESAMPPDTSAPGIVKYAGRPVQVNVARSESDPAQVALTELRRTLSGGERETPAADRESSRTAGAAAPLQLWPWLACAAALLLLLETLVAQRAPEGE
ncbi:MAG: BatA domain-containing protein [Verrucomicrobiota bacterium]